MDPEEQDLDARWSALSLVEKRALLGSPATDYLNPDVLRLIAASFCRDPYSFYALAASCRMAAAALGSDFYPYADIGYMQIWVARLCWRVNAQIPEAPRNSRLRVYHRRVFDEKTRYIKLATVSEFVVDVDKATGLVLNPEHTRALGSVLVRDPERYFGHDETLLWAKSYANMVAEDAAYKEEAKALRSVYDTRTDAIKKLSSAEKKRLFSNVWDESQERRVRFRAAPDQ